MTPGDIRSGTEAARAGIVAGLRALADLLEAHPELPVPDSANTQHSVFASDVPGYANRLAVVERYRDLMVGAGLTVSELVPGAVQVHVSQYPARATYTVHAAEETQAEKKERLTKCASTLDDADHTHRCALYVDAGPHNDSNHICECGKQWGGGAL